MTSRVQTILGLVKHTATIPEGMIQAKMARRCLVEAVGSTGIVGDDSSGRDH